MASDRLATMIQSVLDRSGSGENESLIIASHVSQMKTFGIRQGVELYPEYDDDNRTRAKFISNLWKQNKLGINLDRMWDLLLCKGSLLLYLRPTADGGYRIHYYYGGKGPNDSQFKVFYDEAGNLDEVIIIYNYGFRSLLDLPNARRWVKLRIRKDVIIQSESEIRPNFTQESEYTEGTETKNSLGFIPCVVVWNYPMEDGEGSDEFSWLDNQIVKHDSMSRAVSENMEFFGNPMLVSTRTSQEVLEATSAPRTQVFRPSMASFGSFVGGEIPSTRVDDPRLRNGSGMRVRRVIGGVEQDERFGFIHPDPVSTDHRNYLTQYREILRTALGGVDELGFAAGATAFEIKSLFGRAAATALKKCRSLYDHGLCELFEMAIFAEEEIFRRSVAISFEVDPSEVSDEIIQYLIQQNKLPETATGLIPLGDRTIKWRWTGPVFEDTPQDILQRSIVGRNMQESGVKTTEILRFIYPDKTDKELEGLISGGFPYRYLSNIASTVQQILGLQQQMLQIPDTQNPNQPLGLRLDLGPMLETSLQSFYTELTRTRSPYEPATIQSSYANPLPGDGFAPNRVPELFGSSPASAVPSTPGNASPNGPVPVSGTPISGDLYATTGGIPVPGYDPSSSYGVPASYSGYGYASPFAESSPINVFSSQSSPGAIQPGQQQSLAAGIPRIAGSNSQRPEYASALPRPGTIVSKLPTVPGAIYNTPGVPSQPIPADPSNAAYTDTTGTVSWFERLFPTFAGLLQSVSGGAARSGSRSGRNVSRSRNPRDARTRKG